jgi:hypothetical protein
VRTTVEWARSIAESMLAEQAPDRWEHTQGVAQRVREMRRRLGYEADLVEAAAWLHNVGQATEIAHTGCYQLDGARYLRDVHDCDHVLGELVAHHSGAVIEAEERGLADVLFREFGPGDEHAFLLDALTACDLTSGPDGSRCDPAERVAAIKEHYPPNHVVRRAHERGGESMIRSARRMLGSLSPTVGAAISVNEA